MTLTVTGCENAVYDLSGISGAIRGRGNSTWDFCDKKSYRIKLDNKANLLGAGKGADKDWALLANAREKSMLRNHAAFLLARKMGMEAVTNDAFAVLYLNGEYLGIYQLCETVELGKSRLDLPDGGEETDIGYLLELDKRAKSESKSKLSYFYVNDWKIPFAIKSEITTEEQNAFIKAYVGKADDAILMGDRERIEELIDLASFVDMYLIEEFTKDRDVGFASFYLYKKPGGKLYCGFPWDFDLALGNDSGEDRLAEEDSPKLDYKGAGGIVAGVLNRWFAALTAEDWFLRLCAQRFAALSSDFDAMIEETAATGYAMKTEAERNYERWKIMGQKQLFEPREIVRIRDYGGQVTYLLRWMRDRKAWLAGYFEEYL